MSHESQSPNAEARMREAIEVVGAHVLKTLFTLSDQRLEQNPAEKVAWQCTHNEDSDDVALDLAEVPVIIIDNDTIGLFGFESLAADRVYRREEMGAAVEQVIATSGQAQPRQ